MFFFTILMSSFDKHNFNEVEFIVCEYIYVALFPKAADAISVSVPELSSGLFGLLAPLCLKISPDVQ
jgi:hypothetical protein